MTMILVQFKKPIQPYAASEEQVDDDKQKAAANESSWVYDQKANRAQSSAWAIPGKYCW